MSKHALLVHVVLLALLVSAPVARGADPASILIFPLYDSSGDHETLLTVTNTNDQNRSCGDRTQEGDVIAEFVYIDGETLGEYKVQEFMEPWDTLTVVASRHNPNFEKGYVYVLPRDPASGALLAYDYFLGKAAVFPDGGSHSWSYRAFSLKAADGHAPVGFGRCRRSFADVDRDGQADLDGIEYESPVDGLVLPSFIQQDGAVDNRLVLLAFARPAAQIHYEMTFWTNDSTRFSRTALLPTWWSGRLNEITQFVENLRGDDQELPVVEQTGWVEFAGFRDQVPPTFRKEDQLTRRGRAVAVVGVFMQYIEGKGYADGGALALTGDTPMRGYSVP